ncbi:MAG: phosphosulfolactate synthase [Candidatus Rokuibacteriota bacterium]
MTRAFGSIDVPARPPKPQPRGITMVIDWGLGLRATEDLLEIGAPFADLAQIAVGISGLMDEGFLERVLERVLETAGEAFRTLVFIAGLMVLVGALAHAITWLIARKRTARWVWTYWNGFGILLLVLGVAALGYAWLDLGLQTTGGGALAALGLLLASAGLWMLVPV